MRSTSPPHALTRLAGASTAAAASTGGAVLGAVTAVLAEVRNSPKPLHPRGHHLHATITRSGSAARSGVAWLDEAGTDRAVVRHSAAIGVPFGLPDVQGIALQVDTPQGPAHLLFANTGLGAVNRFVLTLSRRIDGRPYTTLLPYRAPTGPVVLSIEPQSPTRMALAWAPGPGTWNHFGTLELHERYDGTPISFDPMLRTVPDLDPYAWVRALRAPAYRVARRHRGEPPPG